LEHLILAELCKEFSSKWYLDRPDFPNWKMPCNGTLGQPTLPSRSGFWPTVPATESASGIQIFHAVPNRGAPVSRRDPAPLVSWDEQAPPLPAQIAMCIQL